jgi:fermentation-respiration switch protein FrsA (DUF1100 family)
MYSRTQRTICIVASLTCSALLVAQSATSPTAIARAALDLLLAGKYPALGAMFSQSMKNTVTLDFLQDKVSAELKEFGNPQSVGEVILGEEGTNKLVSFPVQFSNTGIHVQFTVDKSGQIAGMFFRPPNKGLPFQWSRPAYSKPESFHERELTIGSDDWKVTGTLTTPAGTGKVPGIVLVHGPGPNDRNESIFATRIFQDLAEGLSSKGLAVLRYDKRSKVHGEELSQMSYTRDGKLAGIILLAGLARPVEDAAKEQTEYVTHLKGDPDPGEQARLDQLAAEVRKVKALDPKGDNPPMVLGFPTTWWLNVKGYDPAAEAKKSGLPMLVLQGERDFQVTMKDFALWKSSLSSRNNVTFHSYPALNDLFIAGEGKGSPAEYHGPGNVAPAVIDDIANWLSTQKK